MMSTQAKERLSQAIGQYSLGESSQHDSSGGGSGAASRHMSNSNQSVGTGVIALKSNTALNAPRKDANTYS